MEINREHFEHWLFSQPPEREFNYVDARGCALCCFLKEIVGIQKPRAVSYECGSDDFKIRIKNPEWLDNQTGAPKILDDSLLTIGYMRRRYLELFPDTELEPTKTIVAELTELPVE